MNRSTEKTQNKTYKQQQILMTVLLDASVLNGRFPYELPTETQQHIFLVGRHRPTPDSTCS